MVPGRRIPLAAGVLIVLGACGGQARGPSAIAMPVLDIDASVAPVPVATDADPEAVLSAMRPLVVTGDKIARRVLFTWTTDEQIAELARTKVLLTRDESPAHGQAHAHAVLDELATKGDDAATLLRTAPFRRARFAWPTAFAAMLGWEGETYGGRLVKVVLKPEAILAVLRVGDAGPEPIAFVDAQDREVTRAEVKAQPERVAAIYFEHHAAPGARPGAYREYVISNESMIESWSVGADDARLELAAEAAALDALAEHLRHVPTAPVDPSAEWRQPAARTVAEAWATCVALGSDHYRLSVEAIARLARELRALPPETTALAVRPTVTFPKAAPTYNIKQPLKNPQPAYRGSPALYTYALPKRRSRP